ncbi:nucleotidyltransferase domain-containing protein [Candidatus Woesearchaeota archaeon]|nr:nucleotidyltransferase domain-containing protein [Candidatus Woesearchaeota archaeon]
MDNKLKIILYLANKGETFTLLDLSKSINIPYASLHRTVAKMQDTTEIESKGKSKLIKIKWNEITKAYLTIASYEEKLEFIKKHHIIKRIEEKSKDITLIFGSYAKETQNKTSDVDLMIINKTGEKTVSFSDLEMLYDIKINPMFFTEKEFIDMLKDKEENVGKQALKAHILLSGFSDFWRLVENGIYKRKI